MTILGIETSCDETAAAVVKNGRVILSNVLASSSKIQSKYGGVIPEIAAREHTKSITPVLKKAITDAALFSSKSMKNYDATTWARKNIDAISVTAGPGLIGCLLVGVEAAKTLSFVWNKPIVPAVHTLAHLYANWLTNKPAPLLPAIVLTVSGGHTDLLLMKDHGEFKLLGGTRDDTAGEAYDKIARHLGLSFPGGPQIQTLAKRGTHRNINFPRPLKYSGDWDFSFSGLKTAVIRQTESSKQNRADIAASTQDAINDVLVSKTIHAAKSFKVRSLLIAGGVAANVDLRTRLEIQSPVKIYAPPIGLCTDNGAFIASYAYFNFKPMNWNKIKAESDTKSAVEKYANN